MKNLIHNLKQLLIALDQLANVLIGLVFGYHSLADETLSAKAYLLELEHGRTWSRKLIDGLFFFDKDHCKESYEYEVLRRQMPPNNTKDTLGCLSQNPFHYKDTLRVASSLRISYL